MIYFLFFISIILLIYGIYLVKDFQSEFDHRFLTIGLTITVISGIMSVLFGIIIFSSI